MLKKNYTKSKKYCRVTFRIPSESGVEKAFLCSDFNNWNKKKCPMKKLRNGDFSATISLAAPESYRFRYLLEGDRWENDPHADDYIPNCFGSEDSVVIV